MVTGGGSGIGRAAALALAKEGAKVAVSDVVVAGGEETVRMITAAGGETIFIKADVAKAAEVEARIKKVVEIYGRLDCAFNNAGIEGEMTTTVDCSEENFDRTIAVNLKGVWLCMKPEIPQMLRQGGGAIVNTASVAGLVGFQGLSACDCVDMADVPPEARELVDEGLMAEEDFRDFVFGKPVRLWGSANPDFFN